LGLNAEMGDESGTGQVFPSGDFRIFAFFCQDRPKRGELVVVKRTSSLRISQI